MKPIISPSILSANFAYLANDIEMINGSEADVMLKGTRVDGIYTADPEKDPTATKFDDITYDEVLKRGLKVMDLTATCIDKAFYIFNKIHCIISWLKRIYWSISIICPATAISIYKHY